MRQGLVQELVQELRESEVWSQQELREPKEQTLWESEAQGLREQQGLELLRGRQQPVQARQQRPV